MVSDAQKAKFAKLPVGALLKISMFVDGHSRHVWGVKVRPFAWSILAPCSKRPLPREVVHYSRYSGETLISRDKLLPMPKKVPKHVRAMHAYYLMKGEFCDILPSAPAES